MVTRTERGWGGHFIGCNGCLFRRNTLLSDGDRFIVVSTVGNYYVKASDGRDVEEIGLGRHYETMAFRGDPRDHYHDAMVDCQINFSSPWALRITKRNEGSVDLLADQMHERVVAEVTANFDAAWSSGESWRKEDRDEP